MAAATAVALGGLLVTLVLTWAAATAHRDNEARLLEQRVQQGAAVLRAAIPAIEQVLVTTVAVAGGATDVELLPATLGTQVGPEARFRSAAVWTSASSEPSGLLGARPYLLERSPDEVADLLRRAAASDTMVVLGLLDADRPALGYALERDDVVVYAEQPLAEDRTRVEQTDEAFADVDYAIYLGDKRDPGNLLAASTGDLPMPGRVERTSIPFGDVELLLVMRAERALGGTLLGRLPWIVAALGALNTAGASFVAHRLQRRRLMAEGLAVENERLFTEQRAQSIGLQQSLLPGALPDVAGVEIVARYRAGVEGTQVGGDWYDAMVVDGRLVLVVGDVSGRGLAAVSTMASARHTTRALAHRDPEPGTVLERVADVERGALDGQFATVACASFDAATGELSVALAGHPPPVVVADGVASLVPARPGPPIGVSGTSRYPTVVVPVPPGGTVYLFTDGLFERRGETIDDGLERLRQSALAQHGDLGASVDGLLAALAGDGVNDDTALLAIRWSP